jgi:hypothetical protein
MPITPTPVNAALDVVANLVLEALGYSSAQRQDAETFNLTSQLAKELAASQYVQWVFTCSLALQAQAMHRKLQGQMPVVVPAASNSQQSQQQQQQQQHLRVKPVHIKLLEALGVPELIGKQDLGHIKKYTWTKPVPEIAVVSCAAYGMYRSRSSSSSSSDGGSSSCVSSSSASSSTGVCSSSSSKGNAAVESTSSQSIGASASSSSSSVETSTGNRSSEIVSTSSTGGASTSNPAASSSSTQQQQQQQVDVLSSSKLYLRRAAVLLELCLLQPHVFMQHVAIQALEPELYNVYTCLLDECSSAAEAGEEYGRVLFGVIMPTTLQQLLPAVWLAVHRHRQRSRSCVSGWRQQWGCT